MTFEYIDGLIWVKRGTTVLGIYRTWEEAHARWDNAQS
jgi:hypothetical protein